MRGITVRHVRHDALAVYGLIGDDVGILSIHGTSVMTNKENETLVWNNIFLSEEYSWQRRITHGPEELD